MKRLYNGRRCKNCDTGFNWERKMITAMGEGTWQEVVDEFGVDCCDSPLMNNDMSVGNFFLDGEPRQFGEGIKNAHVIHAVHQREYFNIDEFGYICNGCFTPEKVATSPEEVTCKNCLHLMGSDT